MKNQVAYWHAEHVNFSRLLDVLDRQLSSFHEGGQPEYTLMIDIVRYLRFFPDRYHHPREDVAFARMVAHDDRLYTQVNRLKQEHRVIAVSGEALLRDLEDVLGDAMVERSKIEAAAATYLAYFRHHLTSEEDNVLPLADRILTERDWSAIAGAVSAGRDPLFGDDPDRQYRELRHRIAVESGQAPAN